MFVFKSRVTCTPISVVVIIDPNRRIYTKTHNLAVLGKCNSELSVTSAWQTKGHVMLRKQRTVTLGATWRIVNITTCH